jgi:Protein of unknown function (DUF2934)
MERQQEHTRKKQQSDTKYNPSTPSLRHSSLHREKENQENEEGYTSRDQSVPLSGEYQTRVAELAYALYEQRGRKDGHDLEDWFNAERQILT